MACLTYRVTEHGRSTSTLYCNLKSKAAFSADSKSANDPTYTRFPSRCTRTSNLPDLFFRTQGEPMMLFLKTPLFVQFSLRVATRRFISLLSCPLRLMWSISFSGHAPWVSAHIARCSGIRTPSTHTVRYLLVEHPAFFPSIRLFTPIQNKLPVSGSYLNACFSRSTATSLRIFNLRGVGIALQDSASDKARKVSGSTHPSRGPWPRPHTSAATASTKRLRQ